MEDSKNKLSYMNKFDKLVELCRVAVELHDEEISQRQKQNDIVVDKSWGGKPVGNDQESKKAWGKRPVSKDQEILQQQQKQNNDIVVDISWGKRHVVSYDQESKKAWGKRPVSNDQEKNKSALFSSKTCCISGEGSFLKKGFKKYKGETSWSSGYYKVVETAPLPVEVANEIQRLGGNDVRLIIQKNLTATDLNSSQNRLSIPINQVREEAEGFLTEAENKTLDERYADNSKVEIQVPLLEPNRNRSHIKFKKWDVNLSFWYTLCGSWSVVQRRNHLQPNMNIQVWSFRVNGVLNLALVRVP